MKAHPRIRKTVKWGGAALTVLLVVVWIGSGWYGVSWVKRRGTQSTLMQGQLQLGNFGDMDYPETPGWQTTGVLPFQMRWWFDTSPTPKVWVLAIPLWTVVLFSTIITAAAWRVDGVCRRRTRLNLCPKCNYDRTGLAAGAVCPECGSGEVPS